MRFFVLICSLILSVSSYATDDCMGLMHAFFNHDDGLAVSNQTSKMDITKYGLKENPTDRLKFETLYRQCTMNEKNDIKTLVDKRFMKIQYGMSAATTIVGYTQMNWDKEKNFEWFARLGFGVTFGTLANAIYFKIMTNNSNRFMSVIKDYAFSRVATLSFIGGSSVFFDPHKNETEKFNNLKNDPKFKEDIKKLKAYADQSNIYERYKKELIAYLSKQKVIDLGLGVHQGVDFDKLTPKDLEDKDIQDVVIAAILAQEYENYKAPLNVTGGYMEDLYLFDSVYSIIKIPKDIIVTNIMSRALCLNTNNPARGYTQAIGVMALNQIFFADFYGISYRVLRSELIDQ